MDSPPLNLFFHPMTPLSSICLRGGGGELFAHSILACIIFKGGQPANKFRKSKIRKFTNLNNLLDLRTQSFVVICELKTSASSQIQNMLFLLTNVSYEALIKLCT